VDDRQFGYITKLREKNPGVGSSSRCAEKVRISQQKKRKKGKKDLLWTNEEGLPTNA
jgi:hypothetical protein